MASFQALSGVRLTELAATFPFVGKAGMEYTAFGQSRLILMPILRSMDRKK